MYFLTTLHSLEKTLLLVFSVFSSLLKNHSWLRNVNTFFLIFIKQQLQFTFQNILRITSAYLDGLGCLKCSFSRPKRLTYRKVDTAEAGG